MRILFARKIIFFSLLSFLFPAGVFAESLIFKFFGHSNFLIKGGGSSVLINPFKSSGCTSNFVEKKNLNQDFILASSRLSDEGFNPRNKLMFVDSGTYKYGDIILNGSLIPHDRVSGRRYGMATVWTWKQNNFKIVHMGGAAGELKIKDKILLSRPDILFISIGGGAKSYNGAEAAQVIKTLKPLSIIPVHFLQKNKTKENCELSDSQEFMENISSDFKVKYVGNKFEINTKDLKEKSIYFFTN